MAGYTTIKNIYEQWIKRIQKPVDALGQDFNTEYAANKNFVFNAAGLAQQAGGTATYKTVNTVKYVIANAYKTVAAAGTQAFSAATPVIAVSSSCAFLVQVDGSGTLSTKAGTVVAAATGSVIPPPDAGKAVIGIINVATDGTHTFTPGTTALDAAGITATYTDAVAFIIPPTLTAFPHQPTRADAGGVTLATYDPSVPQNSGTLDEDNMPQLST